MIFGPSHLNHLCQEYLEFYHHERPHQSLENEPLVKPKRVGRPKAEPNVEANATLRLQDVRCQQRLGGLLKSYSRKAA